MECRGYLHILRSMSVLSCDVILEIGNDATAAIAKTEMMEVMSPRGRERRPGLQLIGVSLDQALIGVEGRPSIEAVDRIICVRRGLGDPFHARAFSPAAQLTLRPGKPGKQ